MVSPCSIRLMVRSAAVSRSSVMRHKLLSFEMKARATGWPMRLPLGADESRPMKGKDAATICNQHAQPSRRQATN